MPTTRQQARAASGQPKPLVSLFVNRTRELVWAAPADDPDWHEGVDLTLEENRELDAVAAKTTAPEVPADDDWLQRRKTKFATELAAGKTRWETVVVHTLPGMSIPNCQALTRSVVWMSRDEVVAACQSGKYARLSALCNVWWV